MHMGNGNRTGNGDGRSGNGSSDRKRNRNSTSDGVVSSSSSNSSIRSSGSTHCTRGGRMSGTMPAPQFMNGGRRTGSSDRLHVVNVRGIGIG